MTETMIFLPEGKKRMFAGAPLLEVISVSITPYAYPCQLHGKISVVDDEGDVNIFDMGPDKSLAIESSTSSLSLPLLNKSRPIIASDGELTVHFDLKNKDGDAEFINGCCSLNGKSLNTLLVTEITGKLGSVSMSYIVHWAAIEADIWATLNRKSLPSDLNANLKVAVGYEYMYQYDIVRFGTREFTIFEGNVSHDDKDEAMSLGGCVLALPTYSEVTIKICLRSCADDTELWNGNFVIGTNNINSSNLTEMGVGESWCPIKLFAVAYNHHSLTVEDINMFKSDNLPKSVFVYDYDDDDDDDDEEEEEEEEESATGA